MRRVLVAVSLVLALVLAGCSARSKKDLVDKAQGITSKAELEKKLGKPDEVSGQVGIPGVVSTETWVYKASDGEVIFQVAGDKVVFGAAREQK